MSTFLEKWEEISHLEWIWEKIFLSLEKSFSWTSEKNINLKILEKLEKNWVNPLPKEIKNNFEQIFEWKIFVLTWTLENFSRDDAKKLIKERWWKTSSSISKNTDFLLFWSEAGSKLEKAKKLWVKLIWEERFLSLVK